MASPKAVVLLSGGLDSTTVLAIAQADGFDAHALTFNYGQRHSVELAAALRVAAARQATHRTVTIDLRTFGGSALTDDTIPVPAPGAPGIPATYVPARNTIFLAYALAYAETIGAHDLYIGVSSVDYSGYPDCRPEYVAAFEALANLATRSAVEGNHIRVHAPLLHLSKADTIRRGLALGVDYGATHSCYNPTGGTPCGLCDSCDLRTRAFAAAGLPDPALAG